MSHIKTVPLSNYENERRRKLFPEVTDLGQSFIRTDPGNCVFPSGYEKYKHQIYNLPLRPDDVLVMTWPKNGTTWSMEMVWLLLNNYDVAKAASLERPQKVTFVEMGIIIDFLQDSIPPGTSFLEVLAEFKARASPRVIKTHLPFCLFPPNLLDQHKVVTCLRNPKDTVVSYYHHEKLWKDHGFTGSFAEYFDLFMDDLVLYSSYWSYTLQLWENRDHPNVCLLFFEDMKADLQNSVRKVARFLGKDPSDEQITTMVNSLDFKKMKKNEAGREDAIKKEAYMEGSQDGSFFRKGDVGDWKNYFTEEMSKRMDEAIEKHFSGTGLQFRYE